MTTIKLSEDVVMRIKDDGYVSISYSREFAPQVNLTREETIALYKALGTHVENDPITPEERKRMEKHALDVWVDGVIKDGERTGKPLRGIARIKELYLRGIARIKEL